MQLVKLSRCCCGWLRPAPCRNATAKVHSDCVRARDILLIFASVLRKQWRVTARWFAEFICARAWCDFKVNTPICAIIRMYGYQYPYIQTCCCSFAFLMSGLRHCYGLLSNSVRLRSNCQRFHNVSPYVSLDSCCFYRVVCVFLLMNDSVRLSVQIHWVGTIRDMICEFGVCSLSSYVCWRSMRSLFCSYQRLVHEHAVLNWIMSCNRNQFVVCPLNFDKRQFATKLVMASSIPILLRCC